MKKVTKKIIKATIVLLRDGFDESDFTNQLKPIIMHESININYNNKITNKRKDYYVKEIDLDLDDDYKYVIAYSNNLKQ